MFRKTGLFLIVMVCGLMRIQAAESQEAGKEPAMAGPFPMTVQFSPVPEGKGWRGGDQPLSEQLIGETIDNAIAHGFTALYVPPQTFAPPVIPEQLKKTITDIAQARGMKVTYQTDGLECFPRNAPPSVCVYSPKYSEVVRQKVAEKLDLFKDFPKIERAFCFQDEPFHQGKESFGYNDEVKVEFKKRYGYDLPPDLDSIRNDPKKWLDVINFRSDYFPDGWRQTYKAIKAVNPNFKAILTHDSHSTFGGAAGSDAQLFVDDVFHWGGDFADTFVYDIYPYMMTDFRYGECSRWPKPRMSHFHYSMAQIRNLTRAYNKELGFWFGTYNDSWFKDFMGEDLRQMSWAERETATTAVAHGANLLITGWAIPQDAAHWAELGKGLNLIQQCGPGLLAAPKLKAKACFLFPRTQCIQLQEEYWNVGLAFELFQRAFGELDVLHEEQVKDDTLDGYPMVCLFDIKLLPKEVTERIAAYAEKGGIVLADCVPQMGQLKEPLDTMKRLFGVEEAATNRIDRSGLWLETRNNPPPRYARPLAHDETPTTTTVKGEALGRAFDFTIVSPRPCRVAGGEVLLKNGADQPALIRHQVGKGQAWLLGFCAQDSFFQTWKAGDEHSRAQLYELVNAVARQSGVTAHVVSTNPDIEATVRANANEGYLFVIDHEAPAKTTRITLNDLPFTIGRVTDVATGQPVEGKMQGSGLKLTADLTGGVTKILRLQP